MNHIQEDIWRTKTSVCIRIQKNENTTDLPIIKPILKSCKSWVLERKKKRMI